MPRKASLSDLPLHETLSFRLRVQIKLWPTYLGVAQFASEILHSA
jgi:hypothetical protein